MVKPEVQPGRPQDPPAQTGAPQSPERQKVEIQSMVDQQVQAKLQSERQDSFRQGETAGRQKATAETEAVVERMARAIEETAGMKGRLRRQAERDVVTLALAMARRVLRRQIVIDEEALLGLVKAAFENVSLREVTEVRVHPQFVARLQGHLSRIGAPEVIRIQGDPGLEIGGVIVETGRGSLDASIETQMDEIARGLSDVLALREGAA
ncbi:FliH/SctL family protein [Paludibaculum fermentans]|uniref:FliH/SctL family protein n=1 Tax=Paludibaculum fermentans TaxID=1473598 RepID=UPI003EC0DC35